MAEDEADCSRSEWQALFLENQVDRLIYHF